MDSAFIYQAANELVQNAGTRNIKQIARSCSLDISETSRIKDMLGLLSLYFDKPLILINRQLDKQTKQMVCGQADSPQSGAGEVAGTASSGIRSTALSRPAPCVY